MLSTETARPAAQRLFNIAIVGATGAVGVELKDCSTAALPGGAMAAALPEQ